MLFYQRFFMKTKKGAEAPFFKIQKWVLNFSFCPSIPLIFPEKFYLQCRAIQALR